MLAGSIDELFLNVQVSRNLFIPLSTIRNNGKCYPKRKDGEEGSWSVTSAHSEAQSRDRDGFRKSYTDNRDRGGSTRQTISIWDLVFPLLEPPLSFDLSDAVLLPGSLYSYQIDGVKWLVESESFLLGDDMGTGKTVQSIVAMRILFQLGRAKSALVIAPLSVLKNWDRELERWAPNLSVTVVRGLPERRRMDWQKRAHVWLATYGTIRQDIEVIESVRLKAPFDVVIADEVQSIKGDTEQSHAVRRVPRARAWGLSGTPIENRLEDLWSIFEFIKPKLLNRRTLTPFSAQQDIKPYFRRRRKQDVLKDLPEKHRMVQWLSLDGRQRDAYDSAEEEGRGKLAGMGSGVTRIHILALLSKLKMLCNREPESGESAKLELLKDKIQVAIDEGCKVLVFSQYKDEGVNFIVDALKKQGAVGFSGDLTPQARDRIIHQFQKDPECRVFVATGAGGLGLTLVEANYVFHFDHWWNPARARQAEDRAHRIGQRKDVFVYDLWTADTVEEKIYRILERKQQLYDDVIDSLSNIDGTGLSERELFELFDLTPPREAGISTLEKLKQLGSREFEELVKRLYESWRYGVRMTPSTRDGGVDLIATKQGATGTAEKLAIQCKRYTEQPVGRPAAQQLLGVISADTSYAKGVIVTTSSFSSECQNFADTQGRLELVGGARLATLIEDARIPLE